MNTFEQLGLPQHLLERLKELNFTTPTPIQQQAIPVALEGKDILGSAQTGTGKTGAFGLPLLAKLLNNSRDAAVVVTPTRELASQVMASLQNFLGRNSGVKTALLIGGEPMPRQEHQLRRRPQLIVGTPGRINDHLERGNLMLHNATTLVLDETDRMLDMGFSQQIDAIVRYLPKKRQTLLFSATLEDGITKVAEKYQNDPVRIAIGQASKPAEGISQELIHIQRDEKYTKLCELLENNQSTTVIFTKTKIKADTLAKKLRKAKHSVEAIHGDLKHTKRERIIKAFRNFKFRILVATDIAARGLDVPHIEHVINYDLPQSPEDYIHRIGRTARAGEKGSAASLITPEDKRLWEAIDKILNPEAYKQKKPQSRQSSGNAGQGRRSRRNQFNKHSRKRSHFGKNPRRDGGSAQGPRRPRKNDK